MTEAAPSRTRPIAGELVALAMPIIGVNVLNVLALGVDTAMCGRLPDAEVALAALGFATQLVFLLMVSMLGLTVGAVATVARAHGAGHEERVTHILRQASQLTTLLGVVIAVVGNLAAPALLRAMGATDEAVSAGLDYLRPLLTGTIFYYLTVLYGAVLRGVGSTRLAFYVALVTNTVNIVLNYGLILGNMGLPALGIAGAAYGTVASQVVGVLLFVVALRKGAVRGVSIPFSFDRIDRPLAASLFRVGWPAALDMLILNASFLSIIGMLGRIDQAAVAAHGIGLRVQSLAFVPGMSISQATGALVGQALGARNVERARSVVKASVVLCAGVMAILGVSLLLSATPIVGIFDVDPATRLGELSILWIQLLGYGLPIVGVHIALSGMLQGAGATGTSLRIQIAGTLLFQIPMSYVLGFVVGWSAFGVWIAFPLSFLVKVGLSTAAYRRGTWARTGAIA